MVATLIFVCGPKNKEVRLIGRLEQSAVTKHAIEENHQIHWKPVVVTKERNTTKRKVKETLKIRELEKRGRKTMNQGSGMQLSKLWLDLV